MGATGTQAVADLYTTYTTYRDQLAAVVEKQSKDQALVTELEREKAEHEANGDRPDAEIVSARLQPAYANLLSDQSEVKRLTKLQDDAQKAWVDARDTLLTAAEKQAAIDEADAEAEAAKIRAQQARDTAAATAAAEKAKQDAAAQAIIDKQVFAQKQSKIITYVGIGLAVLVVLGITYHLIFAKKLPAAE